MISIFDSFQKENKNSESFGVKMELYVQVYFISELSSNRNKTSVEKHNPH